jgi:hypothetical protein
MMILFLGSICLLGAMRQGGLMHNETGPQDTEIKGVKGGRQTELGFEEQDIRVERKGEGGWQMHERLRTEKKLEIYYLACPEP